MHEDEPTRRDAVRTETQTAVLADAQPVALPRRSHRGPGETDHDISAHPEPEPGEPTALGRYVVLGTLGRGGMGTVFEAIDPVLDRRVAVKVLRESSDEEHAQRLIREARALAQLSHPNVVQVYEVGHIEGRVFLAMELVKGQTLRDWMRQEPRPSWRRCMEVFHQAGQGLAAAHARGLVHRDFKPANAILDEGGRVRVLDFGLARPVTSPLEAPSGDRASSGSKEAVASLTRTGVVMGTPAYMSLEQMRESTVDAQCDQFSFCVAFYEALYGTRPFAGSTMEELAANIAAGSITSPPEAARVPAWLSRLVRRGLAASPEGRFPSMQDLLDALVREAAHHRRRRVGMATLGAVAVIGMVSYAVVPAAEQCQGGEAHLGSVWNYERSTAIANAFGASGVSYAADTLARTRQRLDAYAEAWLRTYTEVCEATAVHGRQSPSELDRRIACLDERLAELDALLQVLGEPDPRVIEHAAQATSELRAPAGCALDPSVEMEEVADPERERLRARLHRAEALEHAGRYEDSIALARELAAEAELRGETELHGEALVQLGMAEDLAGNYAGAAEHLRQAYFAANAEGLDLLSAKAAVALVTTEGIHMARGEDGLAWARHAEVALQRSDPGHVLRGRFHAALGSLHFQRFELAEARQHYEQALAIERAALGDDHERVASLMTYLGTVMEQSGQSEEAMRSFEQAIEIHRRALGPQHPELAGLHNNYAVVLFGRQDWAGAQAQFEQAVEIHRQVRGEHPNTALYIDNLGGMLVLQGKVREGRRLIEEALAMREKVLGPEHPMVAQSLSNLAGVVAIDEDWGGARRLSERALAILEKVGGPGNPQVAVLLQNLGTLDLREGAAQSGHDRCRAAVEIYEKEGGPQAPALAEPLAYLGWAQLELEQPAEALRTLERAMSIRDEGQGEYGGLVRLLLARALVKTGGDAARAAKLRAEARAQYRELDESPPERVAAWLHEPG